MSIRRCLPVLLLFLAALSALAASPRRAPDTETLLRQGNAAFAQGDFAGAIALYEQAEARASDPGLVAFNLASAKYQLVRTGEGNATVLREAERLYRCCLGRDDPRRARALYGVGNCLLLRADGPDDLRAALACYEQCEREPLDAQLRADLAYNRQRARLQLAQALAQGTPPDDPSDEEKNKPHPPEPQPPTPQPGGSGDGTPDERYGSTPIKPEAGDKLTQTDAPPAPGAGNLQPIPDSAEPAPLSKADATEHLARAARLVREEGQAYRHSKGRRATSTTRDW